MYIFHVGESQHFRSAFPGRQPGIIDNSQFAIAKCILQIASCFCHPREKQCVLHIAKCILQFAICNCNMFFANCKMYLAICNCKMYLASASVWFFLIRTSRVGFSFSHSAIVVFEVLTLWFFSSTKRSGINICHGDMCSLAADQFSEEMHWICSCMFGLGFCSFMFGFAAAVLEPVTFQFIYAS